MRGRDLRPWVASLSSKPRAEALALSRSLRVGYLEGLLTAARWAERTGAPPATPWEIDAAVAGLWDALVEAGLAHRVSGPDRVWRFSAHGDDSAAGSGHAHGAQHGHFKCRRCERMFCMKPSSRLAGTVRGMLPDGFDGDAVELTVVGRCAECAAAEGGAPHEHGAAADGVGEGGALAATPGR
jgi:Fur family ferric uptake transcriptional regulator